jgi:hypothetical protein
MWIEVSHPAFPNLTFRAVMANTARKGDVQFNSLIPHEIFSPHQLAQGNPLYNSGIQAETATVGKPLRWVYE